MCVRKSSNIGSARVARGPFAPFPIRWWLTLISRRSIHARPCFAVPGGALQKTAAPWAEIPRLPARFHGLHSDVERRRKTGKVRLARRDMHLAAGGYLAPALQHRDGAL